MGEGIGVIVDGVAKSIYASLFISLFAFCIFLYYYKQREIKKMYINKYDIIEAWVVKSLFLIGITLSFAPMMLSISDLVVWQIRPVGLLISQGIESGLNSSEKYAYASLLGGNTFQAIINDYNVYWVANNIAKLAISVYFIYLFNGLKKTANGYIEGKKKEQLVNDVSTGIWLTIEGLVLKFGPYIGMMVGVLFLSIYGYNTFLYFYSPESIDTESVRDLLRSL